MKLCNLIASQLSPSCLFSQHGPISRSFWSALFPPPGGVNSNYPQAFSGFVKTISMHVSPLYYAPYCQLHNAALTVQKLGPFLHRPQTQLFAFNWNTHALTILLATSHCQCYLALNNSNDRLYPCLKFFVIIIGSHSSFPILT